MFASKSLLEHFLRGAVGFAAVTGAIVFARGSNAATVVASIALALVALLAFRGCPICWTVGLFETGWARVRDRE